MPNVKQRDVQNPHFRLPLRRGANGMALVNEQDSSEDIIQCIEVLIAYPIGANWMLPTFGTPDVLFKTTGGQEGVPDQLKTAILQWEARAGMEFGGVPLLNDELLQELVNRVGVTDG